MHLGYSIICHSRLNCNTLNLSVSMYTTTRYRDDIARYRRKARECVKQAVDEMRNCSDSVDVEGKD